MHLKNKIFLIFGIIGILIVIIFYHLNKTDYQIKDEVNSAILTVYGMRTEPIVYSLEDKDMIESLIQRINSITKHNKKLMNENELDKPKGVSYKLEFLGKTKYEYIILHGYCIYNGDVYDIDNYDVYIDDLKEIFW